MPGDEERNGGVQDDAPEDLPTDCSRRRGAVSMKAGDTLATPICALMITGNTATSQVRKTLASEAEARAR